MKKESFSFPLIEFDGNKKPADGLLGSIGFSQKYRGVIDEDDELIVALRSSERDERQTQLILSFAVSWLSGQEKKLGRVIAYAIELPPSIYFLSRIGMIDRTTDVIASGTMVVAGLTGSYLFLDGVWDLMPDDCGINPAAWMAADATLFLIPELIFGKVKEEFGEFGTPIARKDFNPEIVFNFLQLCHVHDVFVADKKLASSHLMRRLQQRIFALFVSISRQSEGMMLSGESEALAALGGQTAIALGVHQTQSHAEILLMIANGIKSIENDKIAKQIEATLDSVRDNMSVDTGQVQRELDRQLASSMATEATGLAAQPVKLTLDLLGTMVGGLTYIAPDQTSSKLVSIVKSGIEQTSTAVEATPDAISKMLQGGIATESWVRNLVTVPSSYAFWRKTKS